MTVRTTQFSTWTFGRRALLVTAVNPSALAQGAAHQTVTVTGNGAATVTVPGKDAVALNTNNLTRQN